MLIFISSKYTADDPEEVRMNVDVAMGAGLEVLRRGHWPVIPHLLHFFDEFAGENGVDIDYETYMQWDNAILEQCDALLYLWGSPGADIELECAKELGIEIFRSLSDIPFKKSEK